MENKDPLVVVDIGQVHVWDLESSGQQDLGMVTTLHAAAMLCLTYFPSPHDA